MCHSKKKMNKIISLFQIVYIGALLMEDMSLSLSNFLNSLRSLVYKPGLISTLTGEAVALSD